MGPVSLRVAAPSGRGLALLALGGVSLLAGLSGALVLLGLPMPSSSAHLGAGHGLLLTLGFLGTLIALERAVALGARWGFAAPAITGLGGLALVVGAPAGVAGGLLLAGGVVYAGMYLAFDRIEATLHTRIQWLGAFGWLGALTLVLAGRPVAVAVPWLGAFLVLTIVGERLELSRVRRLTPAARRAFLAAALLLVVGVAWTIVDFDLGIRLAGVGLVALAAWLGVQDIARRTVRTSGLPRFVAVALLAGFAWLAVAGIGWFSFGATPTTAARDTMIHALFLGFVMSMVFGHAPIILPAVLRVPLPYRARFYAPLVLLHLGLLLRIVAGDALGSQVAWQIGGVIGVVAVLAFAVLSAATAAAPRLALVARPARA